MRNCHSSKLSWGVVICLLLTAGFVQAKLKSEQSKPGYQSPQVAAPLTQTRVHKVGNMWLSITNFGQIGSLTRSRIDLCTGLRAPSWEFPAGSGIDYLYLGALWIGAVVNDTDTLVSTGHDGWQNVQEFYPTSTGAIVARTIRDGGFQQNNCFIPYSDSAKSELDYIAVYYDTATEISPLDPLDGPHKPLKLEVTQKSYSWSYEYANDFVLVDFQIKNIGATKLNQIYIGFYLDFDNNNYDFDGHEDDIAGFKLSLPSAYDPRYEDTVNIAWGADNDGLSANGSEGSPPVFKDYISPTGVIGTRVVRAPGQIQDIKFSFNWWVSNGDASLDFGPWTQENFARRGPLFPPNGQLGTPEGDHSKYFIMSNNEFDYDQLFSALNIWTDQGWLAPQNPSMMPSIADGYDSRYLLSFGPFSIDSDETLPLTVALVAGEDFHVKPIDYLCFNPLDSAGAYCYYNRLDFTSLAANSNWAQCVYDNPRFDTDGDGYDGKYRIIGDDTIYICGDGVPDFKGPPPPPFPKLSFETSQGTVKIKWNGKKTEEFIDQFTSKKDFEGYRIFASWTGLLNDFFLLDSFDKINYKLFYLDKGRRKWVYKLTDLSTDSLIALFQQDDPCLNIRPCPFETLAFCSDSDSCDDRDVARWNLYHPYVYQGTQIETLRVAPSLIITRGDSVYFDRQDFNRGLIPIKVYKDSIIASSIGPDDDRYYDYEYVIDNLNPDNPLYFAVTTFDFGDPITRLAPLETSVLTTSTLVYPRECLFRSGDVNGDGKVLLSDVVDLIEVQFRWGLPYPRPLCRLDANGDKRITFPDVIYLVNYLFRGGPSPQMTEECCLAGD